MTRQLLLRKGKVATISQNSQEMRERGLVIIGNGITGITAARTARKLHPDIRIRIVSAESNYFFSRTALMYIYMGHMRLKETQPYEPQFYSKNRLELVRDHVLRINTKTKQVDLKNGSPLLYSILLIATGSTYNKFGWPGQDLPGVQGLYSLQDLDTLEQNTRNGIRRAVITGGGLIGIELAEMLHTRQIAVTFLVREGRYWGNILPPEEAKLIEQEIADHHITLKLNTQLKEILPDKNNRAQRVITDHGEQIDCQLVGLTAGVRPNLTALQGSDIQTERGVLVDQRLRTNQPDIFSAGDCVQLPSGRVEQLWYTGRMQGEVVGRQIALSAYKKEEDRRLESIPDQPYDRGVWFNSAKFFTIEYQTYGQVAANLEAKNTHVEVDRRKKQLIRLVWEQNGTDDRIIGFNCLGLRLRHDLCAEWIRSQKSAHFVASHLSEACFDPEFYRPAYKNFQTSFFNRFNSRRLF